MIRVTNHTSQPLLVRSLVTDDEEELLNVVVDGNETIDLHPEEAFEQAKINVNVVRELDMIVPRSRCIVRHRAERYEPEVLPEIVFDIGVRLRGDSILDAREDRLRRKLKEFPDSALIASNLGSVLMQKQQYAEAKRWLEQAYQARFSLPDNGRRTLMLMHELGRAMSKRAEIRSMLSAQPAAAEASSLPSAVVSGPTAPVMVATAEPPASAGGEMAAEVTATA